MQRRAEADQLPVCARSRPRVSSYSPAIPGCLLLVIRAGPRLKSNPWVFHVIVFLGRGALEVHVTETLTKICLRLCPIHSERVRWGGEDTPNPSIPRHMRSLDSCVQSSSLRIHISHVCSRFGSDCARA